MVPPVHPQPYKLPLMILLFSLVPFRGKNSILQPPARQVGPGSKLWLNTKRFICNMIRPKTHTNPAKRLFCASKIYILKLHKMGVIICNKSRFL